MNFPKCFPTHVDQYKLVNISNLVENSNLFYKFHLLWIERSGFSLEIQKRKNYFMSLPYATPHVYRHDSLFSQKWRHCPTSWLKEEKGILIDRPEHINHDIVSYGNFSTGTDMNCSGIWLRRAQGLVTLACIFRKYIGFGTYDRESR